MKIFSKDTLKPFDWFLIIGVIVTNLIYSFSFIDNDGINLSNEIIGSIACITGVLCVVLVAKRSISNYIFGIINVSLYAFISYKSKLYGDAALNAFFYFPMQFVGWFFWVRARGGKNSKGEEDSSLVKSLRMTLNGRILLFIVCAAATLIVGYLLSVYTTDPQPYKDSATTVLSIIAMVLLTKKYMEQWFIWIIVNIISIVMWIVIFFRGGDHAILMVIMYLFYLANSINGAIIWNRNSASTTS